jgi:hypothetical protein
MAKEMAETLIPEPITVETGSTRVSPTAQFVELKLPMVAVMFCDLRLLVTNKKTKQKIVNFKIFMDSLWCDRLLFRWKFF